MEICVNDRTRKNHRCTTVSQFNQQPYEIYQNSLIHNKIQRLNCVVGYFNVKIFKMN